MAGYAVYKNSVLVEKNALFGDTSVLAGIVAQRQANDPSLTCVTYDDAHHADFEALVFTPSTSPAQLAWNTLKLTATPLEKFIAQQLGLK